jgi:FkbM family methyltransferase
MMMVALTNVYRKIFLKKRFYKFNKLLFNLSVKGLGILNYENEQLSGESYFLNHIFSDSRKFLVIDVGANVGMYANKIKSLSPTTEIYAFEPHPNTFKELQIASSKNSYSAFNLAIGDNAGELNLYDYEGDADGSQHASIYEDVITKIHKSNSTSWNVKVITLDSFIQENSIKKIHVLKIDTEGNELRVLLGAKQSIQGQMIDVIHFEFNEMNTLSRVFFRDFYDLLPQYAFYRMLPDGLVSLGEYNPLFSEIFAYQNIVAIHKEVRWLTIP